jgi:ADP-ribose pyrophosphatase
MKALICTLLVASSLMAEEPGMREFEKYQQIIEAHPSTIGRLGSYESGEIEILQDPVMIDACIKKTGREVGLVYEDRFWSWINDPVQFPNGSLGIYSRIIFPGTLSDFVGSAVVPLLEDGRIALNCNFRHATRSWELEVPRGFANAGESPEEAASRELVEETGLTAHKLHFLGEMAPDSGTSSALVKLFMAEVSKQGATAHDDSEAIEEIVFLSALELREALKTGVISMEIKGEQKQVFVRDPFLTFALVQMQLRGLFVF